MGSEVNERPRGRPGGLLERARARLGYLLAEESRRLPPVPGPRSEHIAASIAWLRRAHDAAGGGGVAAGYHPARRTWLPAYPETTGYIISTLLRAADWHTSRGEHLPAADLRERARRMGAWEIEVQMAEGCVRAGTLGDGPARPAVFNTGQVMFGWCALHDMDGERVWLDAAGRAARWLIAGQEPDGSWLRGQSPLASNPVHTYDVRAAWGLLEYARLTGDAAARDAARRAADWAAGRQGPDAWFEDTAFDRGKVPSTHPIGYVIEGLLACGLRLGESRHIDSAQRAATALLAHLEPEGALPGAFGRGWLARGRTTCLTGNAQIAIAWGWLHALTGEKAFLDALRLANYFVSRTQRLDDPDPGIRGGVKGSHPNTSGYSPFLYPNWAAKFHIDALLLEEALEADGGADAVRERLPWCG